MIFDSAINGRSTRVKATRNYSARHDAKKKAGVCVATCKNSSAALFTAAKITHFALLPQGRVEARRRAHRMVAQADKEGFGRCSNMEACQVEYPQDISVLRIARMNWEYNRAILSQH